MSVAAIGAVDYTKALDGLSLKQAQLMLTTQGIVGEEQKDLLVRQGLIATSDRMSASIVSEALANTALNKEQQEAILIKAGLMKQETKELITGNACTEAKLRAILAEKGIKGAKADTLIASILQTGQNTKEAISWDVLAASIKKSMIALAQNPLTWIAVAVGAVVGFIKVVDHFAITAEKLNEQLQELKTTEEELISTQDKLTEIDNKIAEIQSKGTLSITDNADISRLQIEKSLLEDEIELLKIRKELQQDEYNKNAKKYADGQYSNYMGGKVGIADVINRYKGYKTKSERTDIDDYFIEDAKRGLKETEAELIEYRNTINENLANLAPDDEESRKKLETIREAIEKLIYAEEELAKIKFDRFIINPNNTGISEGFEKIKSGGEVTTQEITELANKFPTLKKFMDDNGISAETLAAELNNVGTEAENSGENVNKMTVSLSALEKASDKISKLGSAFKELSDDGYITTKTLGEIQAATGLSGDEWTEYENKLLNVKKGSSEFKQILSDLTYKILENEFATIGLENVTEEQIAAILRENGVINANAVAHDVSTNAKARAKLASFDFTKATDAEVDALYEELKAFGFTEIEIKDLAAVYASAQKAMLDAVESGAAGRLGILKSELEGITGIAEAYALLSKNGAPSYDPTGKGNAYVGSELSRMTDEQYAAYLADREKVIAYGNAVEALKKIQDIDITIPNYSVNGKSGSDKNKPDYEDPTDAIIDRINLRHRELEQQEEYIENAREIAELENDYKKQISLTNDLISTRKNRVKELNTANAALYNEAEYLRNSNPWDEDSWFDSQGNATEAYNALFNASSKEQQDQIKDLFEKLSKYKKAYQDNAKEIIVLNKDIIQDERETIPQLWEDLMDDSVSDIEHRIELRNNLVSPDHESNIADYEEIKRLAHLRADAWREAGYGEDSEEVQKWQKTWWDAENSILDESRKIFDERLQLSEDYIQHSKDFGWENGDNEIKARKRVLDWIQSDYYKSLIKDDKEYYKILEEHRLNYLEAQKEEFDKANNFGSSVLDSRKTLLQSYFDVTNSIAEAQHEINKELETSKTMYEWLDEDTRKLLFNQEDYNVLSEELYDIQYKADKLRRQYEHDLENSTLSTVEAITSEYEMQYKTLMKSYEIAKADLEIAKKKQKLNNVLNERNVRMFINGQWQRVANTEDVINAKSELADAEYAKRVEESGLAQQESIDNLTRQQDELSVVIKKFENGVIDLSEAIYLAERAIGNLPDALTSMYDNAKSSSDSISSKYDGLADAYRANDYALAIDEALARGDIDAALAANKIRNEKIDYLGLDAKKWSEEYIKKRFNAYASGTRHTQSGLALMGEDGKEIYINSNGHYIPIEQPTLLSDIKAGGIVFNQDQMKNLNTLWDMSNIKMPDYSSLVNRYDSHNMTTSYDYSVTIKDLVIDNGSTDGQALISALRRYIGNH